METKANRTVYTLSLLLSAPLLVIGAYLKFSGLPYPNLVFFIGVLFVLVYTYVGLWRVIKTRPFVSKLLWLMAFLSINWIAGAVLYFTDFRSSKGLEKV